MNYTKYPQYVPFEKMTKKDNFPEWLAVHCSDSDSDNFESIQRYHVTDPSRLYENFAYHYGIDKEGIIYPGRPEHYHGAHVGESDVDGKRINNKSIGICLFGKFESKMPTPKQINALQELLYTLFKKYNIPPAKVKPHRYWTGKKKTCYGGFIPDDWAARLLSDKLAERVVPESQPIKPVDCSIEVKQAKRGVIDSLINYLKSLL